MMHMDVPLERNLNFKGLSYIYFLKNFENDAFLYNVITRKERHVDKIEYKLFKSIFKLQKIFFKRYRYYHCS
jgi:hypothetical protein